jgi:triosephosphate isomerase
MKKKIIIANWKMNPITYKDAEKLFVGADKSTRSFKKTEIVICPPFVYLGKLKKLSKNIALGAQDVFGKDVGAYTGEISPYMLKDIGVKYVIVGHSERRAMGETNIDINKKIRVSINAGLTPVLCVGEEVREADHGYFNIVKVQLEECLKGVPKDVISKVIIAYEPVWAISTTVNRHDATPADSLEMSLFIKKILSDISSQQSIKNSRVLYGGSVNERDAGEFLKNGGVDGLLVGRASLDVKKFTEIVKIAENEIN